MKRALGLALLVACLVPFAALCAQLDTAPANAPLPVWLTIVQGDPSPGDPGPGGPPPPTTCSCTIHCGNDKSYSGTLDPSTCCSQYNSTCGNSDGSMSGGNISCSPLVSYTPMSVGQRCGGFIIVDSTHSSFVPSTP